ncbi:hypothetical protein BDW62DRAFT_197506 [Aspergillus aurantiobrunneus]
MRYYFWAAALAGAAQAVPAGTSTSTPSTSASSTSTAAIASNSAGIPDPNDLKHVCENGGQTIEAWQELDMGFFLNSTSMMWCDNEEKCPEGPYTMDFMKSLATKLPDQTQFLCVVGKPDCQIPANADWCTNVSYAKYWFALNACRNFHDQIWSVYEALEHGRVTIANYQADIIVKFTKYPEETSSASAVMSIMAGFMSLATGLIALLGPLGWVIDAAVLATLAIVSPILSMTGGTFTLTGGALRLVAKNAAALLQEEISDMGSMAAALDQGFNATQNAVINLGRKAINDVPPNYDINLGYAYKDDPTGAPAILNSGAFAPPIDTSEIQYDKIKMMQTTLASAVSWLWKKHDKAVVAKVTHDMHGQKPCEIELNELYRVCDGDTAYFFVLWDDILHKYKSDGWGKPHGIEHAEDENISLVEFGKAAVYTSEQFGPGHNWDPEGVAVAFGSERKPPNFLMVDIPACTVDTDYFHPVDGGCEGECLLRFNIAIQCENLASNDDNFPYKGGGPFD